MRSGRASRRRPARPPVTEIGSGRTSALRPSRRRCSVSVFAMSTWAAIASAWTPASVRPAAWTAASSPVMRWIASSSACWTEGPWSCRCQPMNGPPSNSIVSRQRVTAGSCLSGSRSRAAARRRSSRSGRRAGPSAAGRSRRPQAMFRRSSRTSPGCPDASSPALGLEQLDPLAIGFEPGARGRERRRGPGARSPRPGVLQSIRASALSIFDA